MSCGRPFLTFTGVTDEVGGSSPRRVLHVYECHEPYGNTCHLDEYRKGQEGPYALVTSLLEHGQVAAALAATVLHAHTYI